MILNGKRENYIWIKIPRTGTKSYEKFFKIYNEFPEQKGAFNETIHWHYTYSQTIEELGKLPGVSVVRNPLSRFISSLKYMAGKKMSCLEEGCIKRRPTNNMVCDAHQFVDFLGSTNECVEFLTENFTYNCYLKKYPARTFMNRQKLDEVLQVRDPQFIQCFFTTQVEFSYHPKVKTFRFEEIETFNGWIEEVLGYDTSLLTHENSSQHVDINVDFNHPDFIKVTEMLFYDDYKAFNYPLQYLT